MRTAHQSAKDRADDVRAGERNVRRQRQRQSLRSWMTTHLTVRCSQSPSCAPSRMPATQYLRSKQSARTISSCHRSLCSGAKYGAVSAGIQVSQSISATLGCFSLEIKASASPGGDVMLRTTQERCARSVVSVESHVVELQRLDATVLAAHFFCVHVQRNVVNQLLHVRLATS